MATLEQFAQNMIKRGKEVVDGTNAKTKLAAGTILQTVVLATPVDSGRARGGWIVGINEPITIDPNILDPTGAGAIAAGTANILNRRKGQTIYISNNVVYIDRLNQGHSAQAPAMFVEQAVKAGLDAIKDGKLLR